MNRLMTIHMEFEYLFSLKKKINVVRISRVKMIIFVCALTSYYLCISVISGRQKYKITFTHSYSAIYTTVFAWHSVGSQGRKAPSCGQQKWSSCAGVQADLSLRWAHMHSCRKCRMQEMLCPGSYAVVSYSATAHGCYHFQSRIKHTFANFFLTFNTWRLYIPQKYSRLSLSRIPRDSLKYFEISVVRHIRFAELRKKIIWLTTFNKLIGNWTFEVRDILKILYKRGEIAP